MTEKKKFKQNAVVLIVKLDLFFPFIITVKYCSIYLKNKRNLCYRKKKAQVVQMEHLMGNAISLALLVKPFLSALAIVEKIVDFLNQKKERVQVKLFHLLC